MVVWDLYPPEYWRTWMCFMTSLPISKETYRFRFMHWGANNEASLFSLTVHKFSACKLHVWAGNGAICCSFFAEESTSHQCISIMWFHLQRVTWIPESGDHLIVACKYHWATSGWTLVFTVILTRWYYFFLRVWQIGNYLLNLGTRISYNLQVVTCHKAKCSSAHFFIITLGLEIFPDYWQRIA